jgi:hypothetical protein
MAQFSRTLSHNYDTKPKNPQGIGGNEIQTKGRRKVFNTIIAEKFPNLETDIDTQEQKAYRVLNRLDEKRNCTHHMTLKMLSLETKKRVLKVAKVYSHTTLKVPNLF